MERDNISILKSKNGTFVAVETDRIVNGYLHNIYGGERSADNEVTYYKYYDGDEWCRLILQCEALDCNDFSFIDDDLADHIFADYENGDDAQELDDIDYVEGDHFIHTFTQDPTNPFLFESKAKDDCHSYEIALGQEIEINNLVERLISYRFFCENYVSEPGDFAIRGNIIDIFPVFSTSPVRLYFLGNKIESIYTFNIADQTKIEDLENCVIIRYFDNIDLDNCVIRTPENTKTEDCAIIEKSENSDIDCKGKEKEAFSFLELGAVLGSYLLGFLIILLLFLFFSGCIFIYRFIEGFNCFSLLFAFTLGCGGLFYFLILQYNDTTAFLEKNNNRI